VIPLIQSITIPTRPVSRLTRIRDGLFARKEKESERKWAVGAAFPLFILFSRSSNLTADEPIPLGMLNESIQSQFAQFRKPNAL
jgi:hypothetical protein